MDGTFFAFNDSMHDFDSGYYWFQAKSVLNNSKAFYNHSTFDEERYFLF